MWIRRVGTIFFFLTFVLMVEVATAYNFKTNSGTNRSRRSLEEAVDNNNSNNNNNDVMYKGSIRPTSCRSYTLVLENQQEASNNNDNNENDNNEQQEQDEQAEEDEEEEVDSNNNNNNNNELNVLVVGQESFVYFDYLSEAGDENSDTGDVVSAQSWFAAITGSSSSTACHLLQDPSTVFSKSVVQNVLVPLGWTESIYFGPVCDNDDDDSTLALGVFVDPYCHSYVPGLSYLINHKFDLSSFVGGVVGNDGNDDDGDTLQGFVQQLDTLNDKYNNNNNNQGDKIYIECQYNEFNACGTILEASVDLDTCTVVSEEIEQQQQQVNQDDQDQDEDAGAENDQNDNDNNNNGRNWGDANYGGAFDEDGLYHMSVQDVQDLTDMCYGLLISQSTGQTLAQWQQAHEEELENELQTIYSVPFVQMFWQSHNVKLLSGLGAFLFFLAILCLIGITVRCQRRREWKQANAERKQSLLDHHHKDSGMTTRKKLRFTRAKKATQQSKSSSEEENHHSDSDSTEGDTPSVNV
ncbi:hypothetical protein IV203_015889 [Nitzschia inconspicua]|uniref:Uncharacterized protein n=1 Tax=Nitzschia inconspicua TaxID=303405 RepID=A0A9K3LBD1_9STRA|nr:hypothetical protein IV203_015889 [Nitzschia inconspicua]